MLLNSIIPSHAIAMSMLEVIRKCLKPFGLGHNVTAQEVVYVTLIAVIALAAGSLLRRGVLYVVRRLPMIRKHKWGQQMLQLHTLQKCSYIISPLVFLCFVPFAFGFDPHSKALGWIYRGVVVYLLCTIGFAVNAVLELWWMTFVSARNTRNIPLHGLLNVCRGIVWIIIVIIAASVLLDKSPTALLAGLGAFSAALLLIFRDSILGFVAGLQISNNDMVRVGDWINVPGTEANGTVLDVTLTAVKVRNWDNTVAMLPPHTLVSGCFINYRGMFDLGARRFVRPIYIDPCTVEPETPEKLRALAEQLPLLKPDVDQALGSDSQLPGLDRGPQQTALLTNLGAFRAYAFAYLHAHPHVAQNQTVLVRLMEETEFGIPVQIYCFTNTTEWIPFEMIHNQIMEHFFTVAPLFGLGVCNDADYNNNVTIQQIPANTPAPGAQS